MSSDPSEDPRVKYLLCNWLGRRVKDWEAEAKRSIGLVESERRAALVGDRLLGFVTMAKGSVTARVENEAALLAYVKKHYPSEIATAEFIEPAFLRRLLDEAKKKGAFVDSDGVVIDGLIEVKAGDPSPRPYPEDDADEIIAELFTSGRVSMDNLTVKAIERGDVEIIDGEVVTEEGSC